MTLRAAHRFIFLILISLLGAGLLSADGTHTWEQSKFEDLIKGTVHGVAIRSTGGLELAPSFKALSTTPSTYIWSLAADSDGSVYAAAGSPARVYRITADGKSTVIFEPQELQVQALVVDKAGAIFAATNPDGKVYKLERRGTAPKKNSSGKAADDSGWDSSLYFDPQTKYIWYLALDGAGNLYVATGDQGQIFRVTPQKEHTVFFKSDEAHIRVLAFDATGNLIAGSDGSGLIYRISPNGTGFVLYSAPKKEITALAIDKSENIYVAGAGEKRSSGAASAPVINLTVTPATGTQAGGTAQGTGGGPAPSAPTTLPSVGGAAAGGSEVYRIAPDGSATRVWTSRDDLVYALAFDPYGTLLAGTGNRGHVYAIHGESRFTDLVTASASQVTAFASAPGGGLYTATSNLGKVFLLGAAPAVEGSYESDVFDAHIFSLWGRAEFRGSGNVELFVRSGNVDNPDRNWSDWKKVELDKEAPIGVPSARFVQWKAVLQGSNPVPRVDGVTLNYLPKNVAPEFDEVSVQAGVHYQPQPKLSGGGLNGGQQPHFDAPPPAISDRDSIGIKWGVHDDNGDDMTYSVYYRGDSERRWLLLKDGITDKFYSFDSSLLPDGGYTVKVVASDAPSHSPGDQLTSERESARFEVDTTPPRIENLAAAIDGAQIHVTFRAVDSFSPIRRAEYSIDAADWQFVEPTGRLSDSKTESYDFRVPVPSGSEHVVVVRAYDSYDNMSAAKTVIREK